MRLSEKRVVGDMREVLIFAPCKREELMVALLQGVYSILREEAGHVYIVKGGFEGEVSCADICNVRDGDVEWTTLIVPCAPCKV